MTTGGLAHLLGGVTLGGLLCLATWLALVAGQLGAPHPENQWVLEAYAHKQRAAAAITEPKVIIAGGSSALFGIDAWQLGDALKRPAVNLGVNAGLGLPVILLQTLQAVNAGDQVVLALEYPLFSYDGELNHVMLNYYLSQPQALLATWRMGRDALPLPRWLALVAKEGAQLALAPTLQRLWQGYRGLPEDFRVTGTYGAHHLDALGNQTHSARAQREPWMLAQALAPGPQRYGAEARPEAVGWALLEHFAAQLRARGACLILMPPALLADPAYRHDPVERAFYTTLPAQAEARGLPYAGRPLDFMYAAEAMFDTNYHLTAEARERHTHRLATALARRLGASGQTAQPTVDCPHPLVEPGVARQPDTHQPAGAQPEQYSPHG